MAKRKKQTQDETTVAEREKSARAEEIRLEPKSGTDTPPAESSEQDEDEIERAVAVEEFAARMELDILHCGDNKTINFRTVNISRPGLQLAGYYKHFSDERVQVIGEMETAYLLQMTHGARKTACETLMQYPIPCIIITSKQPPCEELLSAVQKYNRVLLSSPNRTTVFVNKLALYLTELLAPSQTIHGVLMDIYGVGVLVIGEAGIGKSETALSLIERGHMLVADDAVTITRVGERLIGTSPDVIRYFMEVRGIGIIDVKAMYGAGAVQLDKTIDMVVKLEAWNDKAQYDRMGGESEYYTVLGVKRPLGVIPVKPGRNLAVILEAAARTHRLNDLGFSAAEELNGRLRNKFRK